MQKSLLLAIGIWACAAWPVQARLLSEDPEVLTGRLDNGLTYYLRRNPSGGPCAHWALIRNVGAVVESPQERGLAHLLEHLAFAGTEHFPGNSLLETLARHGVVLGSGVNALTELDQTVFSLYNVPTRDPALADTCLLILRDWARGMTLDPEAVARERAVVVEEWRSGQSPAARLQQQTLPGVYAGSVYAGRDVMGNMEVVRHAEAAQLRSFYGRWYRPDLTALAVVGDIDPPALEARIRSLFAGWEAPAGAPPRLPARIPEASETRYVQALDPEVNQSTVGLYIRHALPPWAALTPQEAVQEEMDVRVFNALAGQRLRRWAQSPQRPFVFASLGFQDLVRGYGAYVLSAVARPGEEARAWEALLLENEHILREGFAPQELERVKQGILAQLARVRQQGAVLDNATHIQSLQDHYLLGKPLLDFETYAAAVEKALDRLSPAYLLSRIRAWNGPANRMVVVTAPSDDGGRALGGLSQAQALEALDRVAALESLPPLAQAPPKAQEPSPVRGQEALALLPELPAPGKVVAERALPVLGAVEWTFSNGLRVVYRQAEAGQGPLRLLSVHEGGSALYGPELRPAAENAAALLTSFGAGPYGPEALQAHLDGKELQLSMQIGDYQSTLEGAASPRDAELLFQLIYLRLTAPRTDSLLWARNLAHNRAALAQAAPLRPEARMQQMARSLAGGIPLLPVDGAYLDRLTLPRLEQVYRERFGAPEATVFFITGALGEARTRALAEQYLGALPVQPFAAQEAGGLRDLPSVTERPLLPMATPKATVYLQWARALDLTPEHLLAHRVLRELLWEGCVRSLREEASGTYEVGVGATEGVRPFPRFAMELSFDCDPARAEELKALAQAQARFLMQEEVGEEALHRARLRAARLLAPALVGEGPAPETSAESEAAWLQRAVDTWFEGWDRSRAEAYHEAWDRLTPERLRAYARDFFQGARTVDLIFLPQAGSPQP